MVRVMSVSVAYLLADAGAATWASSTMSRPFARALAEVVEQRVAVLGPSEERVRDDEAVVRAPRVRAEAALLPPVARRTAAS